MANEKRKNLSKAVYEIGKFTFSGIVIGFVIKFKELTNGELLAFAIAGSVLTVILFFIAYSIDNED